MEHQPANMTKQIPEKSDDSQWPEEPEKFYPTQHVKILQISPTEQRVICECQSCKTPLSIEVVIATPQNTKPKLKSKTDDKPGFDGVQCPSCGKGAIFLVGSTVKAIAELAESPWK
jgi:hypothetical protein